MKMNSKQAPRHCKNICQKNIRCCHLFLIWALQEEEEEKFTELWQCWVSQNQKKYCCEFFKRIFFKKSCLGFPEWEICGGEALIWPFLAFLWHAKKNNIFEFFVDQNAKCSGFFFEENRTHLRLPGSLINRQNTYIWKFEEGEGLKPKTALLSTLTNPTQKHAIQKYRNTLRSVQIVMRKKIRRQKTSNHFFDKKGDV